MKIPFRQGIVRHQTDTQGSQQFLLEQTSTIDLIAENDPTIIAFAHKSKDYIVTEKRSVRMLGLAHLFKVTTIGYTGTSI